MDHDALLVQAVAALLVAKEIGNEDASDPDGDASIGIVQDAGHVVAGGGRDPMNQGRKEIEAEATELLREHGDDVTDAAPSVLVHVRVVASEYARQDISAWRDQVQKGTYGRYHVLGNSRTGR